MWPEPSCTSWSSHRPPVLLPVRMATFADLGEGWRSSVTILGVYRLTLPLAGTRSLSILTFPPAVIFILLRTNPPVCSWGRSCGGTQIKLADPRGILGRTDSLELCERPGRTVGGGRVRGLEGENRQSPGLRPGTACEN